MTAARTTLVDRADLGPHGLRAFPLDPPAVHLEDVTARLRVHPWRQNWVHVHLHGDDDSAYKTLLLVDGEQASYRDTGDPEPLDTGTRSPVPGGLLVTTALLPLPLTQGKQSVEIRLRTYRQSYRTTADVTGTEVADQPSRRFLAIESHTAAVPDPLPNRLGDDASVSVSVSVPGPVIARPPLAPTPPSVDEGRARAAGLEADQRAERERIGRAARAGTRPSIERYREELRFLVATASGPLADVGPDARETVRILLDTIDSHVRDWAMDPLLIGRGGHQADWGGYYSALGEALYLAEPLLLDDAVLGRVAFEAYLGEPFELPDAAVPEIAAGLSPIRARLPHGSRREAWELMLGASFDFARSRLSYIFNQVLYTYEGAWKAHEGLRVIGSSRFEGRERSHRILREAWGLAPFLGEEVLIGPDGEDLDLYHSLFRHDANAVYTDDYREVVMTGRARTALDAAGNPVRRRPYGDHYRGMTAQGLPRENSYVGIYGETANYLPAWIDRLSTHPADAPLRDDLVRLALRNTRARSWLRYPERQVDGTELMRMEQVIDDRNPALPGRVAYAVDSTTGTTFAWAMLARKVLQADGLFAGPEWETERRLAADLLVSARQEWAAGHLFLAFDQDSAHPADQRPYQLRGTPPFLAAFEAVVDRTPAGAPLPHSSAADAGSAVFADTDALVVSLREGDTHLWVNLCSRNTGFAGTGRFHLIQAPAYRGRRPVHVIGTLAVHGTFAAASVLVRGGSGEARRQLGPDHLIGDAPFAWFGHLQPVTSQPGVGPIRRENLNEDNPYSALPDLVWAQVGPYLVALNTARPEHDNARPLALPTGHVLEPGEAQVLGTAEFPVLLPDIDPVRAVVRADDPRTTALAWSPAGGARSYDILEDGHVIAAGVTGSSLVLPDPAHGRLRVDARGETGSACPGSMTPGSMTTGPRPLPLRGGGGGVLIGPATGTVQGEAIGRQEFAIEGGYLADGDDARMDARHRPDAMGFVPHAVAGAFSMTATIVEAEAPIGLMVRADVGAASAALTVLALPEGGVLIQSRDSQTHEDFGAGNPGQDARGGHALSPRQDTFDVQASAVRISRTNGRGLLRIEAQRADGQWTTLLEEWFAIPEVVLVGACALGHGVTTTAVQEH